MIGRLEKTVVDCPDPRALAAFYAEVLSMRVIEDSQDWAAIGFEPHDRRLAFQRASTWIPPRWPDPGHPQQLHLDIRAACSRASRAPASGCSPTRSAIRSV